MIAHPGSWAPLVVIALSASDTDTQDTLSRVVDLVREGDLRAAYSAAEDEPNSVGKAQALLYVRHHAGDLTAALQSGLRGLESSPRDLWLLERTAYLGLSLRDATVAQEMVSRLAEAVASARLEGAEADRWGNLLSDLRSEEHELVENMRRHKLAAVRSRSLACAVLALALWVVVALSRGGGESSRRSASTR